MGLRTRGHRNRILVNLDVSAPTTERFYFMGFINFIAELLKDPRTAIASWIAAGPLMAYGCVFLIIFIETGVVIRCCSPRVSLPTTAALTSWRFWPPHGPLPFWAISATL